MTYTLMLKNGGVFIVVYTREMPSTPVQVDSVQSNTIKD